MRRRRQSCLCLSAAFLAFFVFLIRYFSFRWSISPEPEFSTLRFWPVQREHGKRRRPPVRQKPPNTVNQVSCHLALVPETRAPAFSLDAVYQQERTWLATTRWKVTGILLHWRRPTQIRFILKQWQQLGIFSEFLIWNNHPSITLRAGDLGLSDSPGDIPYKIVNSRVNERDRAKYLACSQASHTVCYYQDDDWDTRDYIESLYRSFITAPDLLHAVTDPYTYATNLQWTFENKSIDLHTGFSWIGCGAYFRRKHAKHFLSTMQTLGLDRSMLDLADVFFSIWLNQYPRQFAYKIIPLASDNAFSAEPGFFELQRKAGELAIRLLHDNLLNNKDQKLFSENKKNDHRSIWAFGVDDQQVFRTSLQADPNGVPFDGQRDWDRATRNHLPRYDQIYDLIQTTSAAAMDLDPSTCWIASRPAVKTTDYFGVELLHPHPISHIKLMFDHSWILQQQFIMEGSIDDQIYVEIPYLRAIPTDKGEPDDVEDPYSEFDGTCASLSSNQTWHRAVKKLNIVFQHHYHVYRYLRFRLDLRNNTQMSTEKVTICELQVVYVRDTPLEPQ